MVAAVIVSISLSVTKAYANDIYISQVGNDLDLTITQDGENNQVEALNGNGNAVLNGNNRTTNLSQTGNTNQYRIWTYGNNQTITADVDGNNNTNSIDNHGDGNDITLDVDGNYNVTHTEIGNGSDENNTMSVTIDGGDNNNVYAEVVDGDSNTIDVQIHNQSNSLARVIVNGTSNDITAWQGKHENGTIDNDETGDNEVYWIVSGNSNTLESYQTDDNSNGGQHIANYITGDSNTVKHTQRGSGDHEGYIDIDGDSNNVTLTQRGNTDTQYADIVLDDGHTVDVFQRYGSHTSNINLTNAGGAYNLDVDQTANSNKSYSLTGICTNANGCSVTVTQN